VIFNFTLPQGLSTRIDWRKFRTLLEQARRVRLDLKPDPGPGPEVVPVEVLQDIATEVEQQQGEALQVTLRRIAATSLNGSIGVLHGTLGVFLAMAMPILGVILVVWLFSFFTRDRGAPGGFVAR